MTSIGKASLRKFKAWMLTRLSPALPAPTTGPLHDHAIPCRYPGGSAVCKCAERMGNDFYFLPADRCLWDNK